MNIVIDSDVIIDYLRAKVGIFPELLESADFETIQFYCPTIVITEVYSGDSSKTTWQEIEKIFTAFTIVSLDRDLAKMAGELRRDNKPLATADSVVAATTLSLNAQLATHNAKHFSQIPGLKFWKEKKK